MSRNQAPGERSLPRKALIAAALPLALLAAVVLQLTVVNRLALPGGDAPDLVLLLVTAVAVRATPLTGALAGFAGGLALDVAPPQSHYAGEYALVFCLAGYAAAWAGAAVEGGSGDRPMVTSLTVMAAAAAAGEAGKAALGLLLSDPNVTGPAIRHVLPGAIAYDLLLSPVMLWLVSLLAGRPASTAVPRPEFAAAWRLAAVFRLASAGAPHLRLAGTGPDHQGRPSLPRREPRLRLAGSGPDHQSRSPARREPRLRLSDARSRSFAAASGAGSPAALPLLAGGRASKLNFSSSRRNRAMGGPGTARRRTPSRGWLRSSPSAGLRSRPVRSSPPRGWLRSQRRSPARSNWYASAPSSRWLRRSRHPWHRRRRRLLSYLPGGTRMIGGRR